MEPKGIYSVLKGVAVGDRPRTRIDILFRCHRKPICSSGFAICSNIPAMELFAALRQEIRVYEVLGGIQSHSRE